MRKSKYNAGDVVISNTPKFGFIDGEVLIVVDGTKVPRYSKYCIKVKKNVVQQNEVKEVIQYIPTKYIEK